MKFCTGFKRFMMDGFTYRGIPYDNEFLSPFRWDLKRWRETTDPNVKSISTAADSIVCRYFSPDIGGPGYMGLPEPDCYYMELEKGLAYRELVTLELSGRAHWLGHVSVEEFDALKARADSSNKSFSDILYDGLPALLAKKSKNLGAFVAPPVVVPEVEDSDGVRPISVTPEADLSWD